MKIAGENTSRFMHFYSALKRGLIKANAVLDVADIYTTIILVVLVSSAIATQSSTLFAPLMRLIRFISAPFLLFFTHQFTSVVRVPADLLKNIFAINSSTLRTFSFHNAHRNFLYCALFSCEITPRDKRTRDNHAGPFRTY